MVVFQSLHVSSEDGGVMHGIMRRLDIHVPDHQSTHEKADEIATDYAHIL